MYKMVIYSANDRTAQSLIGSWETAIDVLNGRHEDSQDLKEFARRFVVNVVEQYTKEPTAGIEDWIAEGDFGGQSPSPQDVAREWDENERTARAERETYE